ncbi:hypothetical protein Tco_1356696 [Tanacetum coccineum]
MQLWKRVAKIVYQCLLLGVMFSGNLESEDTLQLHQIMNSSTTALTMSATNTNRETYSTVNDETKKRIDIEAEAVHIILTGIDNDIHSTVDAYANAK